MGFRPGLEVCSDLRSLSFSDAVIVGAWFTDGSAIADDSRLVPVIKYMTLHVRELQNIISMSMLTFCKGKLDKLTCIFTFI